MKKRNILLMSFLMLASCLGCSRIQNVTSPSISMSMCCNQNSLNDSTMNNDSSYIDENCKEASFKVVAPTCTNEGYTEHVLNNGYIYRDNFKDKIPHHYVDYVIDGDNSLVYSVCSYCGLLKGCEKADADIDTEVIIDRNREKPSFIGHDHMAVSMVLERTPELAIKKIRSSEAHGAHGIMIYLTSLEEKYRNVADLERIMYCTNLPILAIAYASTGLLKLAVEAGACAVDMPGYLFDDYGSIPTKNLGFKGYYTSKGIDVSFVDCHAGEISIDPDVVEKQKQFVSEIHEMGAEVLYSAHVRVEMKSEQIVSAAKFMERLGVDVAKVVCEGSSKETVIEHLKSIIILEKELSIKFSVHGESTLSRLMGPMFGSYIAFCIDDKIENGSSNLQVDLETLIAILEYMEIAKNYS